MAPEEAPWASAVADAHRRQQEALEVEEFRQPREALVAVVSHRPQQEASAAVVSPAWLETEELPAARQESQVVDRTPLVSRYSGSLFRQPLLLASFVLFPGR